ncbi:hypothetical protein D7Y13_09510, partial [Corallococcus praedator]
MYRLCLLGCVVLLSACREKAPEEGALRVTVEYGSYKPACVRVEVQDTQGPRGGTDIVQGQFKNDATKQVLVAVLRKPEWDRELGVTVSSFAAVENNRCAGPAVERFPSESPIAIPPREFARFDVKLVAVDQDGDGSPSGVGLTWTGQPDCDESRKDVHPGAVEQCSDTVDYDCDTLKACEDRDCAEKTCTGGDKCTTNKRCIGVGAAAECGGGVPVVCDQSPNACAPRLSCESSTGMCVPGPSQVGLPCDNGNACMLGKTCDANLNCVGTPKKCDQPTSTACQESLGTCEPTSGQCSYLPKPTSTTCEDGDLCTTDERCNGMGQCVSTPTTCTPPPCFRLQQACSPSTGCQFEVDPTQLNMPCGNTPNGSPGVCLPDGACRPFPFPTHNFTPDDIQPTDIRELITTGNVTLDSDTLQWDVPTSVVNPELIRFLPTPQAAGYPDAVVIPVRTLNLGGDLRILGTRPVILAVYGDATLTHSIFVNGRADITNNVEPGAGGNQACATSQGKNGTFNGKQGGGGGGAGGVTAGAAGGRGLDA